MMNSANIDFTVADCTLFIGQLSEEKKKLLKTCYKNILRYDKVTNSIDRKIGR